jgi:lipid-binding SYLF domain-containing protein
MKTNRTLLVLFSLTLACSFLVGDAQGQRGGASVSTNNNNDNENSFRNTRDQERAIDRSEQAVIIFKKVLEQAKQGHIPQAIFNHTNALMIVPATLKFSTFGGHKGEGIVSIRDYRRGSWTPPIFVTISSLKIDNKEQDNDLILFALNPEAAGAFLTNAFKPQNLLISGEQLLTSNDISAKFDFAVYLYNQKTINLIDISNAKVQQDNAINLAIYGHPRINNFSAFTGPFANRALAFTELLNQLNRSPQ